MGLFYKTPKPKITVEGIEISFLLKHQWWEFNYRGVDFIAFDCSLAMSAKAQLDAMLADLELLKPEMQARLKKGLAEQGDSKVHDGETFLVDVGNFVATKTFSVE